MGMVYFALFVLIGLTFLETFVLSAMVNRVDELKSKVKDLDKRVDDLQDDISAQTGRIDAHEELIADKASIADIERASNAYLNVRNAIGKLGNRIQAIEKDLRKENNNE